MRIPTKPVGTYGGFRISGNTSRLTLSNSHYTHNSDRLAIDKQDLMNLVSEFYLLSSITHQD
jgi:hypothetical protein